MKTTNQKPEYSKLLQKEEHYVYCKKHFQDSLSNKKSKGKTAIVCDTICSYKTKINPQKYILNILHYILYIFLYFCKLTQDAGNPGYLLRVNWVP